jgi:hypothetical protein
MLRLLRTRCSIAFLSRPYLQSTSVVPVPVLLSTRRAASQMALESTATEWQKVSQPDIPSYSIYTIPVVKSERDDREYRVIKLENGLQATLIHDAKTERAAASLDVAVGHLFDPVSISDNPECSHDIYHNSLG